MRFASGLILALMLTGSALADYPKSIRRNTVVPIANRFLDKGIVDGDVLWAMSTEKKTTKTSWQAADRRAKNVYDLYEYHYRPWLKVNEDGTSRSFHAREKRPKNAIALIALPVGTGPKGHETTNYRLVRPTVLYGYDSRTGRVTSRMHRCWLVKRVEKSDGRE